MKKSLLLLLLCCLGVSAAKAQLANGSTAPNFTGTDINGVSHNLYTLLNSGKTVFIDFSATWCHICWDYHNTHALRTIWETYGPPGTNEAFVLFIEGDAGTNTACLYGPSGCSGSTQGNWVAGTPYPIINDASIATLYDISYYPTVYCVCPANKKVYVTGPLSATELWNFRNNTCTTQTAVVLNLNSVTHVRCFNTSTGAIDISVGSGGTAPYTYAWSNGATTQDLNNIPAGIYACTVTASNGSTGTIGNIDVDNPPSALTISVTGTTPAGCNGITGSATVAASGGWGNYSYLWNNGQSGETVNNLNPGNYTATVTDDNNCTKTQVVNIAPPVYPTATIAPPGIITCTQSSLQLSGNGSSVGSNFTYQWTASNGGNITSGGTTLTPTVNAGGTYQLRVTNITNSCTTTSTATVVGNNLPPSLSTTNGTLNCANSSAVLTTSTNATNPSFAWTGPNGYTSNMQSPTVSVSGAYTIIVTNPSSGCTNVAVATVTSNTMPPGASATGGSLTCTVAQLTLSGSSSATQVGYAWAGPNGYTSNLQNPTVNLDGTYNLVATDSINGCTSTAVASVNLNTTAPNATASASGNLNCNTAQLQLSGNGSSQGANFNYLWTTPNGNIVEGATTLTPLVNQVGNYNLVVANTDNGCTAAAATSVAQSQAVTSNISAQTNVTCNGAANGTATVAPGGGNGIFTYAWSNGAASASVGNLVAGTYLVTVTDGENCTASSSAAISQPALLAVNTAATGQTANGVNDGTATAAPTGGTSGYTYAWSNGGSTATITGLAPGTYTVSVTDANTCTAVETTTVNSFNCTLSANISGTNIVCFGANNGTATVSLTGAADPVAYAWSNGAMTQSVGNLAAGAYSVQVLDGNNCPAMLSISIIEPTQLVTNATATHETAAGANNGTATAAPTGGTNGYTYLWSNGATTATITGLAPGTYLISVTDANACTASQMVVVNPFNCTVTAQTTVNNVTCAGAANGSVALSQTGGTAPFTYLWNNGATTSSISNLVPNTYTVLLTDANGCQAVASASVTEPAPYSNFAVQTVNPVCPNQATGSASASISGGTAPYNFLWSNGATTSSIANLNAGAYGLTVTDQNGCATNTSVAIVATDNVPPTVSAQNATISLSANGTAAVTLATVNAQFTDNCAVISTVVAPTTFDCSHKGLQTVTVTVTDQAGLAATATVTVTIIDDTAPTLACPNNIRACSYNNTVNYSLPVPSDNCPLTGGQLIQISGLPSGSAFPVGTTVQRYTFTDASGNTGACFFDVTITPAVNFYDLQVTNASSNQNNGAIDVTLSGGMLPYTFVWANTTGQIVGTTEDLGDLAAGFYSVQVTDGDGCDYSIPAIEVKTATSSTEPSWLAGIRMYPNPTAGLTRIVFAETPADALEITVIDPTGRVMMNQTSEGQATVLLNCSNLPSGFYSVRFHTNAAVGVRKLRVSR